MTSSQQRARNVVACFEVLRDLGSATASDIAKATGLSRPTSQTILRELVEKGLATEGEEKPLAGPGRPGARYRFEPRSKVACFDITDLSVRVGIADLTGAYRLYERHEFSSGVQTREALAETVEDFLKTSPHAEDLISIVVSTPGVVDPAGSFLRVNAFPEFNGYGVRDVLPLPDCEVVLENTVNMATLAEARMGVAQGYDNVVLAHMSGGIKAGLLLGGRLHRGTTFAAGESSYLSLPGVFARASVMSRLNELLDSTIDGATRSRTLEEIAATVAPLLALTVATVDPALVVLTGPDARAGHELLQPLQVELSQLFTSASPPPLTLTELGSDGPMFGGLIAAIENATSALLSGYIPPAPPLRKLTKDWEKYA
ncbi:ROK family transcriptional regulator [Bowdeniella massiliensis]|uniref:ROK family transcriptional regulator n=1 Tax=Bowdeniella massiliensis TaxID=2932264 RepID=UPI0020293856|nr:ROK family transcriptional regulator [Bowdeniella massiliensis]